MASLEIQSFSFSGAVLAGGLSQRMGQDKALISINGETLLARQVRLLRSAGASEVILSQHLMRPRPASSLPRDLHLVWDAPAYSGAGPLAGLAAVLGAARSTLVAVVAVDLPALTLQWWQRCLDSASLECGVVGQRADGFLEPLAAIYPRHAHAVALARLAAGDFAVQAFVRHGLAAGWMRAAILSQADEAQLRNWNSGPLEGSCQSPGTC